MEDYNKRKEAFFKEFNALVEKYKINIGAELSFDKNGIKPAFVFIDISPAKESPIITPDK